MKCNEGNGSLAELSWIWKYYDEVKMSIRIIMNTYV